MGATEGGDRDGLTGREAAGREGKEEGRGGGRGWGGGKKREDFTDGCHGMLGGHRLKG